MKHYAFIGIVHLLYLPMEFVSDFGVPTATADATEGSIELLTRNTLTTAGAAVAAGTAVAGTAVLVAALPAQMALAGGLSAGLYYAGDRKAKGLSINPWSTPKAPLMSDEYEHTAGVDVEATAV
jgi:hypothetical protein